MLKRLLKTLLVQYRVIKVDINDEDLMDKIYRFRYEIYCITDGLLDKKDYKEQLESDNHDRNSTFFIALSRKSDIIGMVRLINSSDGSLPTIEEFKLHDEVKTLTNNFVNLVEVSRFMIKPEYRKTLLMIDLSKAIYKYSINNGVDYWIGCVEEWFLNTIKQITSEIKIIGRPVNCFNAVNYAFIIDINKLKRELSQKSWLFRLLLRL